MNKKLLILYICFLISSFVPSFAIVHGESVSGTTDNQNQVQILNDKNKISSEMDSVEYHTKILQDTVNEMNDVKWYQFWKWHFFMFEGPQKIQYEAKIIESLSRDVGKNGEHIKKNAESSLNNILNTENQSDVNVTDVLYNTGDADDNAKIIANKVSEQFNTKYTAISNDILKNGDIVQYPLSHNNYVYLQYVGNNPSGDKALFLGDNNSAIRLHVSELDKIKYKLKPEAPTKSKNTSTSQQTSYIHKIQEGGLEEYNENKLNEYNNTIGAAKDKIKCGSNLMISGGVIGAAGMILATVAMIMLYAWITTNLISTTAVTIMGVCTVGLAFALLPGILLSLEPINVVIGIFIYLSILFGGISAVLLPTGGGIYASGHSDLNDIENSEQKFENLINTLQKDLNDYNDCGADHLPVAQNKTIDVEQNKNTTSIFNATDADGDEQLYSIIQKPANGFVTVNVNGSYTYTPNIGFVGNDSFTYKSNDVYGDSKVAKINVVVHPHNHPPVSTNLVFDIETNSNLTCQLKSTDIDGDTFKYILVNSTKHGNITLNSNGTVLYIPTVGFIGNDTFTYVSKDWKETGQSATVTIKVHPLNHLPVVSDLNLRMPENENISSVLNTTDIDGDNTIFKLINKPKYGVLRLDGNGMFIYTSKKGFIGNETFTFKTNDWQGESNIGTVNIEVYEFNHKPFAQNISIETYKNKNIKWFFNATDIDENRLTFDVIQNTRHGTVQIFGYGFVYKPTSRFTGHDNFTYRASDGKTISNTALVSIRVLNNKVSMNDHILSVSNTLENQSNPDINSNNTLITPKSIHVLHIPDIKTPKNFEPNKQAMYHPENNTQDITGIIKNITLNNLIKLFIKALESFNIPPEYLNILQQITKQIHLIY